MFEQFSKFAERPRQLFVVGGAVRDAFMGKSTTADIDLCLVGNEKDVSRIFGHCKRIHHEAPVWAVWIDGEMFEVALARREIGGGNSENAVFFEATSIEEDLARRDFTVNAIAIDVWDGSVVDPFCGVNDIEDMVLHPASIQFGESPERVGRAAMMIARFGFRSTAVLIDVCSEMIDDFSRIPREQMWKQFFGKMLAKGRFFTQAFGFMRDVGVFNVFPVFDAMSRTDQDRKWHPEGDVLTHTLLAMDFAGGFDGDRQLVQLALLGHDMGKVKCSAVVDGRVISHGHANENEDFIELMSKIGVPHKMRSRALFLVRSHMRSEFTTARAKARFVRKAAESGVDLSEWMMVVYADKNGRGASVDVPDFVWAVIDFAREFNDSVQIHSRPLVDGNDLISLGLSGRSIGQALRAISDAFVSGEIATVEEAIDIAMEFKK